MKIPAISVIILYKYMSIQSPLIFKKTLVHTYKCKCSINVNQSEEIVERRHFAGEEPTLMLNVFGITPCNYAYILNTIEK